MPRAIVRMMGTPNGGSSFSLEHPFRPDRMSVPFHVDLAASPVSKLATEPVLAGAVGAAGDALLAILGSDPATDAVMRGLSIAQENPLYILLENAPLAERLPWECLRVPDKGFLSLNPCWQVARMRYPDTPVKDEAYRLQPPVRIAAVISAAGDPNVDAAPGLDEWMALVGGAEASPIPVTILALVGEDSLKATIEQQVQSGSLPAAIRGVIVQFVEGSGKLLQALQSFQPNIVHFFCHGATVGSAHLQIGRRIDWVTGSPGGVTITAEDLWSGANAHQNTWMVTLNCCQSAALAADASSLASKLVQYGFPTAVGMREVIDSAEAHLLTRQLYRAIFKRLSVINESQTEAVEWAATLFEARRELIVKRFENAPPPAPTLQAAACDVKNWTLPVLYARPELFRLTRLRSGTLSAEQKVELAQQWDGIKNKIKGIEAIDGMPAAVKAGILKDLGAERTRIEELLAS